MTSDDAVTFIFRAATEALQEKSSERPASIYKGLLIETGSCLEEAATDWNALVDLKVERPGPISSIPEVEAEMAAFNSMAVAAVKILVTMGNFPGLENINPAVTGKNRLD